MMTDEISQKVLIDHQNRTVVTVTNLRWDHAEHSMLSADVLFAELEAMGPIPFTAVPDADTAHGIELWTKDNAGDYGDIADYVAPPPVVPDSVSAQQFKLQLLAAGLLDQVEHGSVAKAKRCRSPMQKAERSFDLSR
jgi:hypothetical protein